MKACIRFPNGNPNVWWDEVYRLSEADFILKKKLREAGSKPDSKTLRNIKARFYDPLPPRERILLSEYRWPESHVQSDLPWEAAEIGMKLLRREYDFGPTDDERLPGSRLGRGPSRDKHAHLGRREPLPVTTGQVLWAYRLSCVAPSMPFTFDPSWMNPDAEGFRRERFGSPAGFWNITHVSWLLDMTDSISEDYYQWDSFLRTECRISFREVVFDYLLWEPWLNQENLDAYGSRSRKMLLGPRVVDYSGPYSDEDLLVPLSPGVSTGSISISGEDIPTATVAKGPQIARLRELGVLIDLAAIPGYEEGMYE